ncbi:MAG: GPI anchored serine-threonine rich family protein [Cyclobacteriaceae bacterium]
MLFRFLFLAVFAFSLSSSFAQSVENVAAEVRDDGVVVLRYDLVGDPDQVRFSIKIYSSHNGFSRPLANVSGDVGDEYEITPGKGKVVEWNASRELGSFNGELSFEVRAQVYRFLLVTQPSSAKAMRRGKTNTITWQGGDTSEKIKIDLLKSGNMIANIGNVDNNGSHQWSAPKELERGNDYSLRFTTSSGEIQSESFSINAKYPLALKVGVPAAVVVGVVLLSSGGSDDGSLPAPPEPN